jgi:hypothetical protein
VSSKRARNCSGPALFLSASCSYLT